MLTIQSKVIFYSYCKIQNISLKIKLLFDLTIKIDWRFNKMNDINKNKKRANSLLDKKTIREKMVQNQDLSIDLILHYDNIGNKESSQNKSSTENDQNMPERITLNNKNTTNKKTHIKTISQRTNPTQQRVTQSIKTRQSHKSNKTQLLSTPHRQNYSQSNHKPMQMCDVYSYHDQKQTLNRTQKLMNLKGTLYHHFQSVGLKERLSCKKKKGSESLSVAKRERAFQSSNQKNVMKLYKRNKKQEGQVSLSSDNSQTKRLMVSKLEKFSEQSSDHQQQKIQKQHKNKNYRPISGYRTGTYEQSIIKKRLSKMEAPFKTDQEKHLINPSLLLQQDQKRNKRYSTKTQSTINANNDNRVSNVLRESDSGIRTVFVKNQHEKKNANKTRNRLSLHPSTNRPSIYIPSFTKHKITAENVQHLINQIELQQQLKQQANQSTYQDGYMTLSNFESTNPTTNNLKLQRQISNIECYFKTKKKEWYSFNQIHGLDGSVGEFDLGQLCQKIQNQLAVLQSSRGIAGLDVDVGWRVGALRRGDNVGKIVKQSPTKHKTINSASNLDNPSLIVQSCINHGKSIQVSQIKSQQFNDSQINKVLQNKLQEFLQNTNQKYTIQPDKPKQIQQISEPNKVFPNPNNSAKPNAQQSYQKKQPKLEKIHQNQTGQNAQQVIQGQHIDKSKQIEASQTSACVIF